MRPCGYRECGIDRVISIHAPREGCDRGDSQIVRWIIIFQSTHPVRGATSSFVPSAYGASFQSTHPVRGATPRFCRLVPMPLFQSTHPVRGATCNTPMMFCTTAIFQSTHPVRGATLLILAHGRFASLHISIHAPREGCDGARVRACARDQGISIHAPREGCDGTNGVRALLL